MKDKLSILHLITDLNVGGAETMLLQVVTRLLAAGHTNTVISLTDGGPLGKKLETLGVPVLALGIRPSLPNPLILFRVAEWIRTNHPDVIQTWMYHADLLGGLSAFIAGKPPVIWGIHNTSLDPRRIKHSTGWIVKRCASLSRWLPRQIVSCSEEARNIHVRLGYRADRFRIIPNGFDLDLFHPDPLARRSIFRELELPANAFLIGLVARFDPLKDHQNFIAAAAMFSREHPQAHFLLCGDKICRSNKLLYGWIDAAGVSEKFHLLGPREDIPRIMAALDVNALASVGEAFPNVLGEAMACGTPCVTTDVGDAATIVGDTGIIVPPGDPQAFANGLEQMIRLTIQQRARLGEKARERIHSRFGIQQISEQYEALYLEVSRNRERL